MLCVGMLFWTLCVLVCGRFRRGASGGALPRRVWERYKICIKMPEAMHDNTSLEPAKRKLKLIARRSCCGSTRPLDLNLSTGAKNKTLSP
jgi:hypothetical protein